MAVQFFILVCFFCIHNTLLALLTVSRTGFKNLGYIYAYIYILIAYHCFSPLLKNRSLKTSFCGMHLLITSMQEMNKKLSVQGKRTECQCGEAEQEGMYGNSACKITLDLLCWYSEITQMQQSTQVCFTDLFWTMGASSSYRQACETLQFVPEMVLCLHCLIQLRYTLNLSFEFRNIEVLIFHM